jgi:hypothetical protein
MPSRNHLYLGLVAAALVLATILARLTRPGPATIVTALFVGVATIEMVAASRDYRRAGAMTRQALALMSADVQPCGTRELLLLIAPVNIRGVPSNINYEAFGQVLGCQPKTLQALLRVVRDDVTVAASVSGNRVTLRVPEYRGNLVGTTDLRNFVVQMPAGRSAEHETPLGRLNTWTDGDTQVFDFALTSEALAMPIFYYSDGRVLRLAQDGR